MPKQFENDLKNHIYSFLPENEKNFPKVILNWEGRPFKGFSVPRIKLHNIFKFDLQKILAQCSSTKVEEFEIQQWQRFSDPQGNPWYNKLIHADSLMGMANLLETGYMDQIQMIYMDPPFGIEFKAGFLSADTTTEGYLDIWQNGLKDYLESLRERFVLCHQLLQESGSIFVQIGESNIHYVRCLLDEVFGSQNFISLITFRTAISTNKIQNIADYLLWYAKDKSKVLRRPLFTDRPEEKSKTTFTYEENSEQTGKAQSFKPQELVKRLTGKKKNPQVFPFTFENQQYVPPLGFEWRWTADQMQELAKTNRIKIINNKLYGKRFPDDFPMMILTNVWTDTSTSTFASQKHYAVHTNPKVIRRCISMTTKPGDLILDPTCGSGTTPYVAEELERRWIAFDTGPAAILGTMSWLLGSIYPCNKWDDNGLDHQYKHISKISLSDLAHNKTSNSLVLYDHPKSKKGKRIVSPFQIQMIGKYQNILQTPQSDSQLPEFSQNGLSFDEWESIFVNCFKVNGILLPSGINWKPDELIPNNLDEIKEIPNDMHLYLTNVNSNEFLLAIGPITGLCEESQWLRFFDQQIFHEKPRTWILFLSFFSLNFYQQLIELQTSESTRNFHIILIHPDLNCSGLDILHHPEAFRLIGIPDVFDDSGDLRIQFFNFNTMDWEILDIDSIATLMIVNDKIMVNQKGSQLNQGMDVELYQMPFFRSFFHSELQYLCRSSLDISDLNSKKLLTASNRKWLIMIDRRGTPHMKLFKDTFCEDHQ
jgi:DNA modification methylase